MFAHNEPWLRRHMVMAYSQSDSTLLSQQGLNSAANRPMAYAHWAAALARSYDCLVIITDINKCY